MMLLVFFVTLAFASQATCQDEKVIRPVCGKFEEPNKCPVLLLEKDAATAESTDKIRCRPCRCIRGYEYDINGVCVPSYQYDPNGARVCVPIKPQCGLNQEPNECPVLQLAIDELTIAESTEKIRCRPCRCIKGYQFNANGECVPIKPQCGLNQEPNECPVLQLAIDELTIAESTEKIRCRPCRCIKGYQFNANGECVPIKPQCGLNQEPNECPVLQLAIDELTIAESTEKIRCRPCRCIKGYQFNANGECVPICGKFEEPNNCTRIQIFNPRLEVAPVAAEPAEIIRCPPCKCVKGYQYDANRNCVPIKPQCGLYEEPNECAVLQLAIDELTATATEKTRCRPCRCVKGYEYDASGVCVPIKPQCGLYQEPNECPVLQLAIDELTIAESTEKIRCRPCRCIKGYQFNANGECVPICGKFEEPNNCTRIQIFNPRAKVAPVAAEPAEIIRCPPCKCVKGYQYDANRNCVPIDTPCVFGECTPTCANPSPPKCPAQSADNACRCPEGYVLTEKGGKCIPLKECPNQNCNGDPNASYVECPNKCKSTCKEPNAICVEECPKPGCQCNSGYILSGEGKCVLPQDCPGGNPCGANNTYVPCTYACPPNYCQLEEHPIAIPCVPPPIICGGGCACQRNYKLSRSNNKCILTSECPPFECKGKNQVYDSCPPPCFSEQCGVVAVVPKVCNTFVAHECAPACVCEKDYRRDASRNCIPMSECPVAAKA